MRNKRVDQKPGRQPPACLLVLAEMQLCEYLWLSCVYTHYFLSASSILPVVSQHCSTEQQPCSCRASRNRTVGLLTGWSKFDRLSPLQRPPSTTAAGKMNPLTQNLFPQRAVSLIIIICNTLSLSFIRKSNPFRKGTKHLKRKVWKWTSGSGRTLSDKVAKGSGLGNVSHDEVASSSWGKRKEMCSVNENRARLFWCLHPTGHIPAKMPLWQSSLRFWPVI